MTEKYFKYLMKQSLPLFALIFGFWAVVLARFINPDNLPAYLAIVSLAIPFLFQFWQFGEKRRTPMGRCQWIERNLSLPGLGVVLFLVLVPAILLLFAVVVQARASLLPR